MAVCERSLVKCNVVVVYLSSYSNMKNICMKLFIHSRMNEDEYMGCRKWRQLKFSHCKQQFMRKLSVTGRKSRVFCKLTFHQRVEDH